MNNKLSGWLLLDKPSGITSAHAVAKVKRLLKPKKIGHAGTLDPLASGILPLALGEATKTVPYMMDAHKSYIFEVAWGAETETDDIEGKMTHTSSKRPSKAELQAILPQFIGEISQMPPQYSAIKVDGKRAYDLARKGEEVALKSRKISINSLEISEYKPDTTTFVCHCGKGTYVRALARDMGRKLGCYGHITLLRRIKVGKFDESQAILLENLERIVHKDGLGFLQPVTSALDDIPAVSVTADQAIALRRGQPVALSLPDTDSVMAAFEGSLLVAVCNVVDGQIRPKRVFNL